MPEQFEKRSDACKWIGRAQMLPENMIWSNIRWTGHDYCCHARKHSPNVATFGARFIGPKALQEEGIPFGTQSIRLVRQQVRWPKSTLERRGAKQSGRGRLPSTSRSCF